MEPPAATPAADAEVALEQALRDGVRVLAAAGVASPRPEVEILAAHLLGVPRGEVRVAAVLGRPAPAGLAALVARRAERVPLQHLTGSAPFRRLDLAVGAGVFIPRPETEQVAGVAIEAARRVLAERGTAVVVDLCTGSGALALAVADEVQGVLVHAVELDRAAFAWATRNVAEHARPPSVVSLVQGDARTSLTHLDGTVDVVVSNPPYIPPDAVPVDQEVRDHDPHVALYGLGPDGLTVPRGVVVAAARLLREGGMLVMEHAEVQADAVRRLVEATGCFQDVRTEQDLTGRDRMVVAARRPRADAEGRGRPGDRLAQDGVKDSRP